MSEQRAQVKVKLEDGNYSRALHRLHARLASGPRIRVPAINAHERV
jgi:hypothetical protein